MFVGASSLTRNSAAGTTFSGVNFSNSSAGKMSSVMRVPATGAIVLQRILYFAPSWCRDRKSVVLGKSVSVRGDLGGSRLIIQKKKDTIKLKSVTSIKSLIFA